MNKPLKEYSLWLEPKGKEYDELKNIIVDFSVETQSPLFDPHVTLLGGITMPVEKIMEKMKILIERKRTITLSLTAIDSTDLYYKSVFLECEKTNELMELNHEAQKLFAQAQEYNPHLSLLYSNISQIKKDLLLEKISHELVLPLSFRANSLSLWKAFGRADEWQRVYDLFL